VTGPDGYLEQTKHVAIVVPPLYGHVNPALGTAAELVRRGHRVTMHLPERFGAAVRSTGAQLIPSPEPEMPGWARTLDHLARFAAMPALQADAARTVLPPVLAALAAEPPDVLAYDQLCVWGRLAAEVSPVPVVQLCTSYAPGRRWSPWPGLSRIPEACTAWSTAITELAGRFGTPPIEVSDLFRDTGAATVVFVPRVLQPEVDAYGDRFAFVGPALRPPLPSDIAELAALELDERPLVFVSMGTLFADLPGLRRLSEAAFADKWWQVVLAGPGERPARRGTVRVRPAVPQLGVLSQAAVAVTHGGMGSVLEALFYAVPLVVVPQMPEQEITANRLVELGVAVRLDRDELTPTRLRAAVDHVATNRRLRRAVQRMAHAVRAAGGAPAAASAVLGTTVAAPSSVSTDR
jgi:MGT family glycosyltransferase